VDRVGRADCAQSLNATVPLKARLRPMRGLRTDRTASTVIRGHAFVQNLRRGHYELGLEARHERLRVAAAFDELAEAI
jgi:IS6 family transposase